MEKRGADFDWCLAKLCTESSASQMSQIQKVLFESHVVGRIENPEDESVRHKLFCGVTKLEGPSLGRSGFDNEFAATSPFNKRGRSPRESDLKCGSSRTP